VNTCLTQRVLLSLALAAAIGAFPPQITAEQDEKTYTLFASGDTMLARWVPQSFTTKGLEWTIGDFLPLIRNADIAMTNLECVIATKGWYADKGESRPFLYRTLPYMMDLLVGMGIDFVTTANNHGMDYGPEAVIEQDELLKAAGIAQAGTGANKQEACSPAYVQTGDVIVAFISIETMKPLFSAGKNHPGICHARSSKRILKTLKDPVQEARKKADLVVVSPHWGANWTENPTESRITLAHSIIDMGVDAIIGHSSHHLHGIEVYRGKPVLYDTGALLFDRVAQGRMQLSAGFILEFNRHGFSRVAIHPVHVRNNRTIAPSSSKTATINRLIQELSRQIDPDIVFEKDGDIYVVNLKPDPPPPAPRKKPVEVYKSGSTRPLNAAVRNRPDDVRVKSVPAWAEGFRPVKMDIGITVLGARNPIAVYPGRGFVSEVVIRVDGPLKGEWNPRTEVRKPGTNKGFSHAHCFGEGTWLPKFWKKGDFLIDRTFVRPPGKYRETGLFEIYWGIREMRSRRFGIITSPAQFKGNKRLKTGEILLTKKGVPKGPAGVAWDGGVFMKEFGKRTRAYASSGRIQRMLPVLGILVSLGLLFMAVVLIRRTRLRKNY